jgi:hypothetical protein
MKWWRSSSTWTPRALCTGNGVAFNAVSPAPGSSTVEERSITVDRETFEATYRRVCPGLWEKHTEVWASVASEAGRIRTKQGPTDYRAGDYLVYNDADGRDGWAMSP